jgi:hypothetical protein
MLFSAPSVQVVITTFRQAQGDNPFDGVRMVFTLSLPKGYRKRLYNFFKPSYLVKIEMDKHLYLFFRREGEIYPCTLKAI